MNINPIGYQATTARGNDYKKSNLGKTAALASVVAFDVAMNTVPKLNKSKLASWMKLDTLLKDISEVTGKAIKVSKKQKLAINIAAYAVDGLLALGVGAVIDKMINRSRAKKADRM